mmetsp:Transcript_11646/g.17255  ORF Transcript_11646/g.17255 Transcript_11646/m.17255 type:complete len:193 (-) Transcript_11646:625-1203(-)|eukprot:CAMPEP_0117418184 /NCGR_PEP_ID=MMETSP0758-20121206/24_1 /TAXON_ID=63605 /ORGANISM="Percolomonas cosmopolitus, Strain AE-1 (ATCC 50343)" /LENGTH=192 /DNA_ID=CAMNT_0005198551 /DNA_START=41 /DNA_END=619 /DNA_ORIENTATION=+
MGKKTKKAIVAPPVTHEFRIYRLGKNQEIVEVPTPTLRLRIQMPKVSPNHIQLSIKENTWSVNTLSHPVYKYERPEGAYPEGVSIDLSVFSSWDGPRRASMGPNYLEVMVPLADVPPALNRAQYELAHKMKEEKQIKFSHVSNKKAMQVVEEGEKKSAARRRKRDAAQYHSKQLAEREVRREARKKRKRMKK